MKLSARAQAVLQRATNEFVQQVANLVAGDTVTTVHAALRERLAELTSGVPPPPTPTRQPRRARRSAKGVTVERLVQLLRAGGGAVTPKVVSKAFDLSPPRRRALVAEAVAAGLVRTEGVRRQTLYVLS